MLRRLGAERHLHTELTEMQSSFFFFFLPLIQLLIEIHTNTSFPFLGRSQFLWALQALKGGRSHHRIPAKENASYGATVCLKQMDKNLISKLLDPKLCRLASNPFREVAANFCRVSEKHSSSRLL